MNLPFKTIIIYLLAKSTIQIVCPDYYYTYVNVNIPKFIKNSEKFADSITHCPDFKDPKTALCCEFKEYAELSERFTNKYFNTKQNINVLNVKSRQL
jgi:hypothetical protein